MIFLLLFSWHLVVPGLLLTYLLRVRALRILTALALSYFLLLLNLVPFKVLGGSVNLFTVLVNAEILLLGTALFLRWRSANQMSIASDPSSMRAGTSLSTETFGLNSNLIYRVGGGVLTGFSAVAYLLYVGPYTEIPADAWHHLGEIQRQYNDIRRGWIQPLPEFELIFSKYAGYWYFVPAYISYLAGITVAESMMPLTIATSVSFLLGIYVFALFMFAQGVLSQREITALAVLTAMFYLLHFGVNIFSYVRYYAFAPSILNFIVYFSTIGLVIQYLRGDAEAARIAILWLLHMVVLGMVHPQEALFAIIMFILLVVYYFVCRGQMPQFSGPGANRGSACHDLGEVRSRINFTFWLVLAVVLVGTAYSYANLERHDPMAHGRMIPMDTLMPFAGNMYVLDPGRDFYQTVTVWGVLVYVGFFITFGDFRNYPYIVVAMLSPLLTVFNPVFTDLFLRYSWPELLWRMCYLIPLPFAAAYLLMKGYKAVRDANGTLLKFASVVFLILLVATLLPTHSKYVEARYSRIYTLAPVASGNDYEIWSDLIDFLRTERTGAILTDPVTGYVVRGSTGKRYEGQKFHGLQNIRLNYDAYDKTTFAKFADDWLLIVNRRNGSTSANGRLSGHWPENVLKVEQYYSQELLDHVAGNPDIFVKLWENNGITVYRISKKEL